MCFYEDFWKSGWDQTKGKGIRRKGGADDTIEIYMNEKWFVFEYREESEWENKR